MSTIFILLLLSCKDNQYAAVCAGNAVQTLQCEPPDLKYTISQSERDIELQ